MKRRKMSNKDQLSENQLEAIRKSRSVRRSLAFESHLLFFLIYLAHYIRYPFAPFHYKIFELSEDRNAKRVVLTAFRDSGKSTINTLSLPIWAIVGILKKKFVLIASQTQQQAKTHLANIRKELEGNELLKNDIGPFREESDEWGATSLVLSNYDARITVASTEQSIRGIRHGAHRPDLVACDDVEDLNSVKTREGRNKTWNWFTGEILPIGSKDTKFVIVGNILHEDSLIMRLKKVIEEERLDALYLEYPIVKGDDEISWPGKFPAMEDIEKLKVTVASDVAWHREYLLRIISDADRIVHPEWIHYYEKLPVNKPEYIATGIDLAISQKEHADYTAMVSAAVHRIDDELKIFILPNPVNKRLDFPATVETAIGLSKTLGDGTYTKLFIEEVGYQQALIQHLVDKDIPAEGVKTSGQDKRARLALVTHLIPQGKVLFPKNGAEELIGQLTNFGIENHDDLADAFALLLLKILEIGIQPEVIWAFVGDFYNRGRGLYDSDEDDDW